MIKKLIFTEWQKDIIEDESKIIMANISRGGSKTFLLANKVLQDKPKTVQYINSNIGQLKILKDRFEEMFALDEIIRESIRYYNFSRKKLFIEFNTGEKITIYDKDERFDEDEIIDMVLFDDGLPQLDIKAKKYVSVFTIKYPIMNFFNWRKDISYYVIGIKKLEEWGLLTKEQIKKTKERLGDADFDKYFDICNEYKEMFEKEKPVRGLRRNANLYEESAGDLNIKSNIDFKNEILKRREVLGNKVEVFNSVVNNNLENIHKLFKDYKHSIEASYDAEGYIRIKFIIKDGIHESHHFFNHIKGSDDEHNIKEVTENKLRNFIVRIAMNKNISINN